MNRDAQLYWLARRVSRGQPISVEVVMRELHLSEPSAQALMAGPWSELVPLVDREESAPVVSRPTRHCPRCRAMLVERRPGHVWCVCGYSDEPADERDKVVGIDLVENPRPPDRLRYRRTDHSVLPWSDDEIEAWRRYDAGEEVMPVEAWDKLRPQYVTKGETTPCEHCGKPLTRMGRKQHLERWCPVRKASEARPIRPL